MAGKPEALSKYPDDPALREAWNKAAIDAHTTPGVDTKLGLDGVVKENGITTVYAYKSDGKNVKGVAINQTTS